ncbi:MAG: murein L,D-transpeptidase [Ilumatobacteraceae bacterium]|nr:murein L,D-transpeptidase [Ilumatobacteraceae bacterium]
MNTSEHRTLLMSGVGIVAAAILVVALVSGGSNTSTSPNDSTSTSSSSLVDIEPVTTVPGTDSSTAPGTDPVDITGEEPTSDEPCVITELSLAGGDTGPSVTCLQEALIVAGFLNTAATGVYDNATAAAVEKLQTDRDLFVDGKTGRETALSLGVWPDENSLVIRTPPPTPGAVDLLGYELSSVATSGPDTPPLPPDSGSGRRLVYDRAGQRIWAVGEDNVVIRSWLVSGSKYNNETPGSHAVYSRSDVSTAWNGKAFLYKMVRWLKTDIGAIGFHALPIRRSDNTPYQTDAELGTRLSGGCQRQANLDADFTWEFAQIGTPVIVI